MAGTQGTGETWGTDGVAARTGSGRQTVGPRAGVYQHVGFAVDTTWVTYSKQLR